MLKRARRTWTTPGDSAEKLVHECVVTRDEIQLQTWICQAENMIRPGDGNAGGNVFGEDLAPRLSGLLFRSMGITSVPWTGGKMRDGAVHYVSTLYDGALAPATYRVLELDDLAALTTVARRKAARYPHWHHKQYVPVFGFYQEISDSTGVGLVPALKIITDGGPNNGFLSDGVIIEARLGPFGFIGAFDHKDPANGVDFRDARERLPNGQPNPAFARFSSPPAKPNGWEFG